MALPVAIQLYSLRDYMDKDFEGTLKKVKELGYDGVEFAGLYGQDPKAVKAMCDEIGLVPVSAHIPLQDFIDQGIDTVLDTYETVGVKYFAIPYLTEERRPGGPRFMDETDPENTVAVMKKIGEAAAKRGMLQLYHNHDFEFTAKINGKYALEVLYESIPAEHLASELDTCWVNIGGEIPAEYILKYEGRAPIVHLKDFYKTGKLPQHLYALIGIDEEEAEAEESTFEFRFVGGGMQDMPAILASAQKAGAYWVVVEQDEVTPGTNAIECATKSIEYLRSFEW